MKKALSSHSDRRCTMHPFSAALIVILGEEYLIPCALAGCLCAVFLAQVLSEWCVRFLHDFDPQHPEKLKKYGELTPLLRRLQTQSETIRCHTRSRGHKRHRQRRGASSGRNCVQSCR